MGGEEQVFFRRRKFFLIGLTAICRLFATDVGVPLRHLHQMADTGVTQRGRRAETTGVVSIKARFVIGIASSFD